jgi:GNAT superfamily N-acetyltransferase
MPSDPMEIDAISNAFTSHWRLFGLYPGAELTEEDGVLWYHSPIRHLPYNAVIRTRLAEGSDPEAIVARVCAHFRERDLPFMWVVLPLDRPSGYEGHLSRQGLELVEEATGMSRSLADWSPSGRKFKSEVVTAGEEPAITDYDLLIRTYWSVPEADRATIQIMNRHWTGGRSPGVRLVAYVDGKPVGKLFLNLASLPDAAVYGVAVIPEARGRGIASEMLETAMNWAQGVGAMRMVLHSSPMGRPVYEKFGFAAHCPIPIYATAPLFGTHHH